jgi:hypothetical protein
MLERAKFLLLRQHSEEEFARTAIDQAITKCVDEVCLNIQEYIQDKLRLPDCPDYTASDTATYNFVRDGMPIVQLQVTDCVQTFFYDIGTNLGAIFAYGSDQIGAYDRLLLANEVNISLYIDRLYSNLANIVSYTSPLIDIEYMPGENMVDHVASHNFGLYEDEVWLTRELHLQGDLGDMLHGPEHTTKDEVSDPLAASDPSSPPCDICGDTNTAMRKLKASQHQMCEECLTA